MIDLLSRSPCNRQPSSTLVGTKKEKEVHHHPCMIEGMECSSPRLEDAHILATSNDLLFLSVLFLRINGQPQPLTRGTHFRLIPDQS